MNTDSYFNYVDNLDNSYREVFNQVVRYVDLLDGMSAAKKDEKMNDLLDVMLSAQEAGKPVEKVCGKNVQTFCREFCAEYDIRFAVYEVLSSCRFLIWLLLFDSFFFTLEWLLDPEIRQAGGLFWAKSQEAGGIDFILIITAIELCSVLIGLVGRHIMFVKKKDSEKMIKIARVILALVCVAVIIMVITDHWNMIVLPLGIQLIGSLIWLGVCYYLKSILKDDLEEGFLKDMKKIMADQIPAEIDEQFPAAMEKKYFAMRNKKQKKGLSYTIEDYLKDEEKTSLKMLRLKNFYLFLPVICTAIGFLISSGILTGGAGAGMSAEEAMEVILCVGISFIVEVIVMYFLWKFIKKTALMRLAWIREKRTSEKRTSEKETYEA